ncbi:MAG: OmpA family protein [Ferruginibacter sp.]|nr:OmpA family protein [Bacteroidota bacterium]MBX2920455.1 OmpA family protein [Ferruginibacter sp.]MCB0710188.1 OmpA family protein [Chitinophagaceae bacterium]
MQNKSSYILRFICSFFIFITAFLVAPAQWYNPDKVNKKAGEVYALAYEEAIAANYKAALKHLEEAIKLDPKFVDVYLSRAGIYAELKNYEASVADFEKGIQMDSVYSKTYLLPYSISLAGVGKFKEALNAVNEFLANPTLNPQSIKAGNYRKSTYSFAVDYEKKHPVKNYVFKPVNLGDSINTSDLEYFPSLTIDGSKMIFTRRVASDEDFYESDFIDGRWSKAKPLGGKVNTNFNEGAQNISQDGQLLVFTGCNYPEGEGSCDLYFSIKTNTGWSEPQNLGPVVNTDFWESSPSLSPDKRDLYFASSRAGGFGGRDIWVTHRMPNGKWSRPQNLGESVNTSGDESCPFIHADNETLYFNSNGHTGYGMTDLFFSKKINDSIWAPAENLGYPINNIDDQGSLIVAADGKTAYYASDGADTRGGLDIYSFQLRDDIRPLKTLWVKGKVYDKKTNAGLPSSVELTNVKTDRIVSKIQTDEDGNYLITLPVGNDYAFNVNRRGYLFYSDNFSITPNTDSVFIVNIALQPIEKGASIVLKNIFFETGKFDLQNESKSELDKLVELLNDNPNLKIQIDGHTDNVGQQKDNLELSNNRAKSVVGYLLSKGINQQRLSFKGFGATKPVADNNTETGRAKNRRTELYVTGN